MPFLVNFRPSQNSLAGLERVVSNRVEHIPQVQLAGHGVAVVDDDLRELVSLLCTIPAVD